MKNLVSKFAEKLRGSPRLAPDQYVKKLQSRGLGPDGRQVPDSTPMAPPVGFRKQPSMFDIQRDMIRQHMAEFARSQDMESLEDFEDFEVGDEPHELVSGYENEGDPPLEELLAAGRQAIAEREERERAGAASSRDMPPSGPPEGSTEPPPNTLT